MCFVATQLQESAASGSREEGAKWRVVMFRPSVAIIVSTFLGTFSQAQSMQTQSMQTQSKDVLRADESDPRAPVNTPEQGPRVWPPTAIEERMAALRLPPIPRQEPEGNSKGMVSVQQALNPLTKEKAEALNRANLQLQSGDKESGRKRLEQALEDPASAGYAHAMLGTAYLKEGKVKVALEHLHEAVRLVPGLVSARSNLGYALGATGEWDLAQKELRKAIALNASDPHPNFVLGVMLLNDAETYHEAKTRLEVAREELPRASLALAVLFEKQQDADAVEREVQRLSQQPAAQDALRTWIQAVADLQNPASAFRLFGGGAE
jgi:Flp pilus assembly protein TadD